MTPPWLADLRRSFKRHRQGRTGWFISEHHDRLRILSAELPPRPEEPASEIPVTRSIYLKAAPGPTTATAALVEACNLFDAVMAGTWRWPGSLSAEAPGPQERTRQAVIAAVTRRLREQLVGERLVEATWVRYWIPYLKRLQETAAAEPCLDDAAFLRTYLRRWAVNSRSRQMAYDKARALWKEAHWSWPEGLQEMRGTGRAAADPQGVRAFTDEEIEELRLRIQRSKLTASDLLAWDVLAVFGLRPQELQGLEIKEGPEGVPVAIVSRVKRNSKGAFGARQVPALPPIQWSVDCHGLLKRWHTFGLPDRLVRERSPGQGLTQQLRRLRMPGDLTVYGLRHAWALRAGIDLGLSVREAAELMGHSPAVHLSTYGRRLDQPKLQSRVASLVMQRARAGSS